MIIAKRLFASAGNGRGTSLKGDGFSTGWGLPAPETLGFAVDSFRVAVGDRERVCGRPDLGFRSPSRCTLGYIRLSRWGPRHGRGRVRGAGPRAPHPGPGGERALEKEGAGEADK
jgi:hypothetical protein